MVAPRGSRSSPALITMSMKSGKWNVTGCALYGAPATFAIALLSHHASDAAYVVLIPLAAIVWHETGRHPLAGVAVAYAGISGAFAGNLLPGQFDALILGITQAAAQMLEPGRALNPLGNWAFTATLGLLLLAVAWPVADRIVEPRLQRLQPCLLYTSPSPRD